MYADGPPSLRIATTTVRCACGIPMGSEKPAGLAATGRHAPLGHITAHLLREEWWRKTGEWVGDEVMHDDGRTTSRREKPHDGHSCNPCLYIAASPGFGPAQWATIIAALIAALVVVAGYALTQMQARRERRAKEFADALAAIEEYLEAPYRIRRRQPTPVAREALTTSLSDLQARIAFHLAWLQVGGTDA